MAPRIVTADCGHSFEDKPQYSIPRPGAPATCADCGLKNILAEAHTWNVKLVHTAERLLGNIAGTSNNDYDPVNERLSRAVLIGFALGILKLQEQKFFQDQRLIRDWEDQWGTPWDAERVDVDVGQSGGKIEVSVNVKRHPDGAECTDQRFLLPGPAMSLMRINRP
jgi:hypothetical protein